MDGNNDIAVFDELIRDVAQGQRALQAWLDKTDNLAEVRYTERQMAAAAESLKKCRDGERITLLESNTAASANLRCQRRGGEILAVMEKHKGRPKKKGGHDDPLSLQDTLGTETADRAKNISKRWQAIAAVPEKEFEEMINVTARTQEESEIRASEVIQRGADIKAGRNGPPVKRNTGEDEWYTPGCYIEAARKTMGGIDLDPASSKRANRVVKAAEFFGLRDDGLQQPWAGRIWLNPPFSNLLPFATKLIAEYSDGKDVPQAIMLGPNYSDSKWWQDAAEYAAAICHTNHRIRFISSLSGEVSGGSPTNGHTFFYFGTRVATFTTQFSTFGVIK